MRRRDFLATIAGSLVAAEKSILVHEHILVDFIGAEEIRPGRYDPEEVFRVARSKLGEVRKLGCVRLLECTPNYLGRDARLCRRLEQATGVEIWTNTGLYGAANHKYVPAFARRETAEELARRWVAEYEQGIDGVRPRFIKTGVDKAPLDELDRKLIRAAALASRATGLTVASHTGDGAAALAQLEIFAAEGVALEKFVWVHAQNERDHAIHERVARAGAWVEFDGISEKTADWHLSCVRHMAGAGLLGRVLISQDAGWYRVGEPGGGAYRGYTYIYTDFVPRLDVTWRRRLLWENPTAAFGAA